MTGKTPNKVSPKIGTESPDIVDELSKFIEKKRIQNMSLRKIVDKLNAKEEYKNETK